MLSKPKFGINIQILNNQIKKGLAMNILFQLFQALKETTQAFLFEAVENKSAGASEDELRLPPSDAHCQCKK
ncbi:MAG: hypothetical protein DRI57_19020 [Deltaproteobacteria bacterium]|nr:MAG: hypothetical protein DRI57_19020 [Deltaproteobacteria bacterium]